MHILPRRPCIPVSVFAFLAARVRTASRIVLAVALIAAVAMPNDAEAQDRTPVDAGRSLDAGAASTITVTTPSAAETLVRARSTVDVPRERRVVQRGGGSPLDGEIGPGEAAAMRDPARTDADDTQGPRI